MRETKFRGKSLDSGEWVYGDLIENLIDDKESFIIITKNSVYSQLFDSTLYIDSTSWREVNNKTVGQYIGRKDINGLEIYEGHVVKGKRPLRWCSGYENVLGEIIFDTEHAMFKVSNGGDITNIENLEIIGNIHDDIKISGRENGFY